MFYFIDVLKAIASILITNSHYGSIWPNSSLATGGLLGDIIFFAVSGFCLYSIKQKFHIWYLKRIIRIYPLLWIVNIAAIFVGYIAVFNARSFFSIFIYPTIYHFISSIMVLYIFYYFVIWLQNKFKINLIYSMLTVFVLYLLNYIFFFDRSYYHIDVVEEYTIRFLFFESMLLGAYFRKKIENPPVRSILPKAGGVILFMFLYFISKVIFSKYPLLSQFQILNQIIIFVLLYFIMDFCSHWEITRKSHSLILDKIIKFLSGLTLEIYLVQYIVYYIMPDMNFPLNFIFVTFFILLFASVAGVISKFLSHKLNFILEANSNE